MLIGCSEKPYLVPDLRGKSFSLSPLSMMLAMDLSYMFFVILRYASFMPHFKCFYHEWMLNFVKYFFCIYKIMKSFFLSFY